MAKDDPKGAVAWRRWTLQNGRGWMSRFHLVDENGIALCGIRPAADAESVDLENPGAKRCRGCLKLAPYYPGFDVRRPEQDASSRV